MRENRVLVYGVEETRGSPVVRSLEGGARIRIRNPENTVLLRAMFGEKEVGV